MSAIATNLRTLRQHQQLTLEQLAEAIGVARQTISKWESGESAPDLASADHLAHFFKVTLDDLVHYDATDSGIGIPPKGKFLFGTVQVGERGQIVIPKAARQQFQLTKGTALTLLGDQTGKMPGLALVKSADFLQQAQAFKS